MKTVSVNVSTLCVPCCNHCRYCLLSWDGKIVGADYPRAQVYAERFYRWICLNRPDLSFQFYFGYSMEHPHLLDTIDFSKRIGSVGGDFLQLDGLQLRTKPQTLNFLQGIHSHGVRAIGLTFYGTRTYHDRFAARAGDFDYLMQILESAIAVGLEADVGIAVTAENASQLEALLTLLQSYPLRHLHCFVPHGEGRGAAIESIRFRTEDYLQLSDSVRQYLNRNRFKSEKQWLQENSFSVPQKRMLGLSLTPDNIGFFEPMDFADTIAYLEKLDDDYYQKIPPLSVLAQHYGNPDCEKFYSERDLYLKYQRQYIQAHQLSVYDIHDERQCFSRRF